MNIKFNINQNVRVKLTDYGRLLLKQDHAMLCKEVGIKEDYIPPKEDKDGWSEWQLWVLMSKLGKYCMMGFNMPPFETNIECEHLKAMDNHAWCNKIEGICFDYKNPKTNPTK